MTPGAGIVFVNPKAGEDDDSDSIESLFEGHEVLECAPDALEDAVRSALARDPAFVGVAGGDGSIRCVVEVVTTERPSVPVLPIPAGTRNHFAHDLGFDDIEAAAHAAEAGSTRTVDVGRVNDHVFVNNSSVGAYPRLVAYRETHHRSLPKGIANIASAWRQLRTGRHIRLSVDGDRVMAWAVFVGNNCYGESLLDLVGRDRLDGGVLDVRIAHADRRWSRLRIVGAVLFGRVAQSPLIERRQVDRVELDFGKGRSVDVALDGEVMSMSSPLEFLSAAGALTVVASVSGERP